MILLQFTKILAPDPFLIPLAIDENAGAKKGIQYWKMTTSGSVLLIYFTVFFHENGFTELINLSTFSSSKSKNCDFPGNNDLGYCKENDTLWISCPLDNSFAKEWLNIEIPPR